MHRLWPALIIPLVVGCGGQSPRPATTSPTVVSDQLTPVPAEQPGSKDEPRPDKPFSPMPVAVSPSWPVFRGNANSTGVSDVTLPDELTERWVFRCKDSVEGAAAIVDGVVYFGSTDKHLYAVDLATGREKWKAKLGYLKASPAVRDDRVYIGDIEGNVFCVNAADGSKEWTYTPEFGGEIVSGCNFHGDNILVAAQGMPVTCLNPNGKLAWAFEIDGGSNGSPTVNEDVVFASGCDSRFHAIDAKNGKELWSVEISGQAAATSAVFGDFAYVGTVTNQVLAIDLKNRKVEWTFEPPLKSQAFYSSAAVTDQFVIVGSRDQKVYALDRKTGEPKWSYVTEGMVDPSPVVAGATVYFGPLSLTAEFYALDLKTGKKRQELTLEGAATGSPAVGPDCLIVGTEKGVVYCFGK